jgi:hypothetical protein
MGRARGGHPRRKQKGDTLKAGVIAPSRHPDSVPTAVVAGSVRRVVSDVAVAMSMLLVASHQHPCKRGRGAVVGAASHMVRTTLAALALAVAGVPLAHAEAYTSIGYGEVTCGTFNQQPDFAKQMTHQWEVGYLTGMSNGLSSGVDMLAHTDYGAIATWIDRYCEANPLDYV